MRGWEAGDEGWGRPIPMEGAGGWGRGREAADVKRTLGTAPPEVEGEGVCDTGWRAGGRG